MEKTEQQLYISIMVLQEEGYDRDAIMELLDMSEHEYDYIIEMNEPADWYY